MSQSGSERLREVQNVAISVDVVAVIIAGVVVVLVVIVFGLLLWSLRLCC